MFLQNLKLVNFRNFSKLELDLPKTLLVYGENSLGKSTFLESIYFLATTKSPKAEKDNQLIKIGESFTSVSGTVEGSEGEDKLEIIMQKRLEEFGNDFEKRTKVNGVSKRVVDYIGHLTVILFSPEDINLVTGTPALRRWHIDLTLAQIDMEYKKALTIYSQALISRNRILKRIREGLAKYDELDFWTDQVMKYGEVIQKKRNDLFEFLNKQNFLESFGTLNFQYQESTISVDRLKEYLPREVASASSLIGPHRDDFCFNLNSRNLGFFGSRGQQRTAVLDLKLAELKFIQDIKKNLPILLLDDVFSELDKKHRDYVLSIVFGQQTILSTVETDNIPRDFLNSVEVKNIENFLG